MRKNLTRDRKAHRGSVLVTGASGYLGRLIAATLLRHETADLVLPVRDKHSRESVLAAIADELAFEGESPDHDWVERVHVVTLPALERLDLLEPVVRRTNVTEVIHCAGCLDYFDSDALEAINVELTRLLLGHCGHWNIRRITYMSSAFSSGYVDGLVAEALHPEPATDPTEYTRTKRAAERLVAESGIPFLCLRPAIVIGDSRTGHYVGKQYGLYQLWSGIERLLCAQWEPEFHVVAPRQPAYLVHQDALQNAFLAAWRRLPPNSFVNIVSDLDKVPDGRALWNLWMEECFRPRKVHYYDTVADLPLRSMPRKQRALMGFASVNLEIASHPWRFETTNLDLLCNEGLEFPHVTLESLARCQRRFMQVSRRIQEFLEDASPAVVREPEFVEQV